MPQQLTEPQTKALRVLHEYGGEAVIDKHGWLVARGVRIHGTAPETWLRLVTLGMIEGAGPMRLRVTADGVEAAKPAPVKIPFGGLGSRHVPALEGAE